MASPADSPSPVAQLTLREGEQGSSDREHVTLPFPDELAQGSAASPTTAHGSDFGLVSLVSPLAAPEEESLHFLPMSPPETFRLPVPEDSTLEAEAEASDVTQKKPPELAGEGVDER